MIHRVLQFNPFLPRLKPYINFYTQKRTNAENSIERDFFKLMNNSVFGKTMENIRDKIDVTFVTSKNKLLKLASKPTFVSSKIFCENVVVHKIKETLTLNNGSSYVGMYILDLPKTLKCMILVIKLICYLKYATKLNYYSLTQVRKFN